MWHEKWWTTKIEQVFPDITDDIKLGLLKRWAYFDKSFRMNSKNIPDPDILIRTGGTKRLSNFLLWQLAYSEIFFEKKLWPDFNENDYNKILSKFKKIKRNFGNI